MNKNLLLSLSASCLMVTAVGMASSPYISKVYEYKPAPGQFINELPEYEQGDTYSVMLAKVGEQLIGDKTPGMITLGAYGGYVVFGFDHPVINKAGDYDFKVYGNALISDRDNRGGSSEPGIVMVSEDVNGNGLPDDPWYELAGSEYAKESTIKGYKVTYYAPDPTHVADPDPDYKYINDRTYIRWTSNEQAKPEGYVMRNTYHSQSYWPEWIEDKTMEFEGTKMADNYVDISGDGTYYVQIFSDWGYVDNLPNTEDKGFNIEWAVNADGQPVALEKIHFVKVYTAVNQYCGWLGETSTEVAGAEDLHPDYDPTGIDAVTADRDILLVTSRSANSLTVRSSAATTYVIYSTAGTQVANGHLFVGENSLDISDLNAGIYLLHTDKATVKFTK